MTDVIDTVVERLTTLLGADPAREKGVLHSAYVDARTAVPRVLRIGPFTPPCADDTFLLHAARARASAIVTTGRILRDEPTLHYDLGVAVGLHDALLAYRRERVGRVEPPTVGVLTRSGVGLDHPALHGYGRAVVIVTGEPEAGFERAAERASVEVARLPGADFEGVLAWLRARGHDTVLVEAGIATTGPVYAAGRGFDELVLTAIESGEVDARAVGEPFVAWDRLEAWYGRALHERVASAGDGSARIRRYRRGSTGAGG